MKMKEDKTTTYEVRLLCRNCNTEWVESVEKGTYVKYEKDNNYKIKMGHSFKKGKFLIAQSVVPIQKYQGCPLQNLVTNKIY